MDLFDLRSWPGFKGASGDISSAAMINQVVIDSRQIDSKDSLFIALSGKVTDGHHYVEQAAALGTKFILVHPSFTTSDPFIRKKLLFTENPILALQEIATAYRSTLPTQIVAITGSYGKTMVKDLLGEMLKTSFNCKSSPESFNSQIGIPLSLFNLSKNHEIGIIEAAISEKNEMDLIEKMLTPDCGIITQIGEKHIDRLEDIPTLTQEIVKLFKNPKVKWLSLPDHLALTPHLNTINSSLSFWNKKELSYPHAELLAEPNDLSLPFRICFPDNSIYNGQITSGFNYYLDLLNMTIKAAFRLGVSKENICRALDQYTLEPIRTEIWKSPSGVTFINASYSEDPISIDHALKNLKVISGNGHKIFLFGGLKGTHEASDYKRVGAIISRYQLDTLILIGDNDFTPLIDALQNHPSTSIIKAPNYQEALDLYKLSMHREDTVLIKGTKKLPLDTVIKTFHDSLCTNLCQINLATIENNIKIIRKKLGEKVRIMVMVKAFAYGTDAFRIAKFLSLCGVDILGVSYVEEGVSLKRAGVDQAIFVLNGSLYEIEKIVKWELEIGVSDANFIANLANEASIQKKIIPVHLHVDTGMSRFGCRPEKALDLAKLITSFPSLELVGVMTHFASSDEPSEDKFTKEQSQKLDAVILDLKNNNIVPKWTHAANSAAALRFSFPQYNMVRIGLAVYGLYASPNMERTPGIRLAISLISRIAGINICKKGDTISYGRSYLVKEDEKKIAVLPIGYFDGLHRNYSGRSNVLIRGKLAPMLGKICMDFMMVDVSSIQGVEIGDPVLIFGEDDYGHYLSPEHLAYQGDSIIHELITCLGPRIQRIFIYEESHQRDINGNKSSLQ